MHAHQMATPLTPPRHTPTPRTTTSLEVAERTTTHIEAHHSVEATLTEGEELVPTIRISANSRHTPQPNSRTELSCSTSHTLLLRHLAPRVSQLLVQHLCQMLLRDRTVSHQNRKLSAQHSHPQVPQYLANPGSSVSNSSVGVCTRHGCPLLHDPNKQALCKRWLFKNDCNRGDHCSLSHEPTPHNVPTCLHFQEGRCTNEDCRFAHIRVNPAAQICDAFGRLGYCEKGAECADLHAYECPDFANKGECIRGDKCQHRHVHRASRMRKSTGRSSPEDLSRATSPEVGSNNPETHGWATKSSASQAASHTPHLFTQQVDYVPFDIED